MFSGCFIECLQVYMIKVICFCVFCLDDTKKNKFFKFSAPVFDSVIPAFLKPLILE